MVGGTGRQLSYLCHGMGQQGHELHVLLSGGNGFLSALKESGATIHNLDLKSNHSPALFLKVLKTIRATKPDLVQTWFRQMDIAGGVAALRSGLLWVISERSSAMAYRPSLKHSLRSSLGAGADAVICNSKSGRDYWVDRQRLGSKIYVIPNAVPFKVVQQVSPVEEMPSSLKPDGSLLICAARLVPSKNIDVFVRAVALVAKKVAVRAVICGDGPQREILEKLVVELGLHGRVLLLGEVSNVWGWMKRASVFVSMSRYEGSPNTVLEAMACGCPMVLSNITQHLEICDQTMASFVEPQSPEQLGNEILRLLADPELARERAENALCRVTEFSIATMASRYSRAYSDLRKPASHS